MRIQGHSTYCRAIRLITTQTKVDFGEMWGFENPGKIKYDICIPKYLM